MCFVLIATLHCHLLFLCLIRSVSVYQEQLMREVAWVMYDEIHLCSLPHSIAITSTLAAFDCSCTNR